MQATTRLCVMIFALVSSMGVARAQQPKTYKPAPSVGRWEMIGQKTVNRAKEWDEFDPTSIGIYVAFKVKVTKADVDFDRVVVLFDNGQQQEVQLNRVIRQGGESRKVDLVGQQRKIKKIRVKYRTTSFFNSRAVVQIWGQR